MIQPKLIFPLPYLEARRSDNIIICLQGDLKYFKGLGFGEIGEKEVDTIHVSVGLSCFVFPLDAVS